MLRLSLGRKILLAGSATAVLAIASPSFGQIGGIGGGAGVGGSGGVGPSVGPVGGGTPAAPAVPNVNPGNIGAGGTGNVGGSGSGSIGNQGASGAGSVGGQGRGTVGNAVQGSGNAAGQAQGNVGKATGNAAGNVGGQGQGALGNQTGNIGGNVTGQGQGSIGNRAGNAAGNVTGQGQGSLGNRTGNAAGNLGGQVQGTVQGAQGGAFDVSRRGALGVSVNPSNGTLSVSNIHNGSVAQRAGLQTGDQIVSINGQAVRTHQDLSAALSSAADLNNATSIAIRRNGQLQNLQVDLSGAAGGAVRGALDTAAGASASAGRPILGIGVEPDAQGLRITRVNPGSVAEQLQLQPNDRVVSVNGRNVMSSAELATELNGVLEGNGQAAIVVNRAGQTRTVNHTFERAGEGAERAADRAGDRAPNAVDRGANRLDTNVNPNRQ